MKPEFWGKARIKVIGVGGAGCNAVDRMIQIGIPEVTFIAANTDAQALAQSEAPHKIQLGPNLTHGLGAGGNPETGKRAAQESQRLLSEAIQDTDLIFIAAGMGGGTGTGAAPVIARLAREAHALSIAIVTRPFTFEGPRRLETAEAGLEALQAAADALIVVSNDRLLQVISKHIPLNVAFRVADEVLRQGVQGITELITQPGLINLDFADVKAVIGNAGKALMSMGYAEGKDKAREAARIAVENPLMEIETIEDAENLLVNFSGGEDLGLSEVNAAMEYLTRVTHPEAQIFFGVTIDPHSKGSVQVTLIATGLQGRSSPPMPPSRTTGRRHTLADLLGDTFLVPAVPAPKPEVIHLA